MDNNTNLQLMLDIKNIQILLLRLNILKHLFKQIRMQVGQLRKIQGPKVLELNCLILFNNQDLFISQSRIYDYHKSCILFDNLQFKMHDDLPFIYPADFESKNATNQESERHRLATRIFKGLIPDSATHDRCECCDRRIGEPGNAKGCWYSPIYDLVFLGPGVPLLFVFVQNAMLALVLLTALFFFYSLITNLFGNSCELNTKCILDVFNELSISNKINDNQSLMIQTYLVAAFLLIYIIFSQYMIFRVRFRNDKCDDVINSPSDYSIIIKNLPENVQQHHIEALIEQHRANLDFELKSHTKNLKIKKIILSYGLQEYLKKKQEQEEQFLKVKKEDEDAVFQRVPIARPTTTASFAIIVFDTQLAKETFFEDPQAKKSCKSLLVHCCQKVIQYQVDSKPVLIERAPEPDDILWENADIPKWRWMRNISLSYFFGVIILAGGGVIQYYLQYFQNQITDVTTRSYFSYATSFIVTIFNVIIVQFLIFVTKLEGNQTKTDLDRSLLVKISLYSFFNAGIFYSIATILAQSLNSFNIQGSFSFQITLFMSLNAITPNLINFILTKLEFPAIIIRFMARMGCCKYTQAEANKLYELGEVDFPVKYAYIIRTVWLTCFYAPFAPIIVPISIFGLIFFYFAETELFRTSYRAPNMLSMNITLTAMRLLDYTGVVLSGGQILITLYVKFIFSSTFTLPQQIGVALCVGLSIILIFIPSQKINERLYPFINNLEDMPDYDTALKEFQITYEGANPLSDPSQRVRKNDHNLFKFLNIFDVMQMRNSRSPSTASKSTPNPLLNMFAQPNELFSVNQPEPIHNQYQNNFNPNYPYFNQHQNNFNQDPSNMFNQFNQLNNRLL